MHCRRCRYELSRIESRVCPECGTAFDPADPATFHAVPSSRRDGVVILVAAFAIGGMIELVLYGLGTVFPRAWQSMPFVAAALLVVGPLIAGWRADLSHGLVVYGAVVVATQLFPAVTLVTTGPSWLEVDGRDIAKGAAAWAFVLAVAMLACRFVGRWSWQWNNRRRAQRTTSSVRLKLAVAIVVAVGFLPVAWVAWGTGTVLLGAPTINVDHHQRLAELRLSHLGADAAESYPAWGAFEKMLTTAATAIAEYDETRAEQPFTPRSSRDQGELDFDFVRTGVALPEGIERERGALAALAAAGIPEQLADVARGPIALRPPPGGNPALMAVTLPYLDPAQRLALAQIAAMRIAGAEGDIDALVRRFDEVLAVARMLSCQGTAIDWHVANSIHARAVHEMMCQLDERDFDVATCTQMLRVLDDRTLADLALPLAGEDAMFHDAVQRSFTDDGHGDGYLLANGLSPFLAAPGVIPPTGTGWHERLSTAFTARFLMGTRREQIAAQKAIHDAAAVLSALPPHERAHAPEMQLVSGGSITDHLPVVKALVGTWPLVLSREAVARSCHAGARTRLGIELFEARFHRPPVSLEELTREVAGMDAVDPMTGAPFGYRLDDEGFLLYAFGLDGVDDGGLFDPNVATAGWMSDRGATDVPLPGPRRSWTD